MAKKVTRRQMIRTGAVGAAGIALARSSGPALGALGANERVRVAVAGINGQGNHHISRFSQMKDTELVYVVDPDSRLHASRIEKSERESNGRSKPKGVQDIRQVLEDKSIDAISIATPNHWHSLMTIWACQAGKDVYVEKPLSHNIHEGRVLVQAARRYKRIVQHGTQSRSDKGWAHVAAAIASGKLGRLHVSRGLCYKPGGGGTTRGDIGFKPIQEPPTGFDWGLWQGPVKFLKYHENLVHYRWHWFWETGNGDLGNQGVHQMDVARWMIPGATLPKSVISFGGRLTEFDQAEVANTEISIMDFGDTQLIFETRCWPSEDYHGQGIGNVMHLDAGIIAGKTFYPKGSMEPAPLPEVEHSRGPGGDPYENFVAAIKSRRIEDLNAECLEGHYSSALCHLANMSIRLGYKIPFKPETQEFGDNEHAYEVLRRTTDHLAANGVDVDNSGYVMGRRLNVDIANERIIDDAEANALLTRDYRKGYEMPDRIV